MLNWYWLLNLLSHCSTNKTKGASKIGQWNNLKENQRATILLILTLSTVDIAIISTTIGLYATKIGVSYLPIEILCYIGIILQGLSMLAIVFSWRPVKRFTPTFYVTLFGLCCTAGQTLIYILYLKSNFDPENPRINANFELTLYAASKCIIIELIFRSYYIRYLAIIAPTVIAYVAFTEISKLSLATLLLSIFLGIMSTYLRNKVRSNYLNNLDSGVKKVLAFKEILKFLPSSVMLLDTKGSITFQNEYVENKFKVGGNSKDLLALFYDLKPRPPREEPTETPNTGNNDANQNTMAPTQPLSSKLQNLMVKPFNTLQDLVSSYTQVDEAELLFKLSKPFIYDCKFRDEKDKSIRSIEVKASHIKLESQELVYALILRDTTMRDRLANLEGAQAFKDQLLATFSHELRTPLNTNLNMIACAIEQKEVTSRIKENYLLPAKYSGLLLLSLIDDFLDYSQLCLNTIQIRIGSVNIKRICGHIHALFKRQAEKKNIQFSYEIDEPIPETVFTDEDRLKQIIINLVGNSLKFTRKGSIKIIVKEVTEGLCFTVKDTGVGMSSSEIEKLKHHISNPYSGRLISKQTAGAGIGLLIASNLSLILGPRGGCGFKIESAPDEGASFTFIIRDFKMKCILDGKHLIETELKYKSRSKKRSKVQDSSPARSDLQTMKDFPASEGQLLLTEQEAKDKPPRDTIDLSRPVVVHDDVSLIVPAEKTQTDHYINTSPSCHFFDKPEQKQQVFSFVTKFNQDEDPEILIVDDDAFNVISLETILKSLNKTYKSAFNGKEAIDCVLSSCQRLSSDPSLQGFRLILMDVNMPVMDGLDATRELKKRMNAGEIPQIPIVICTAYISTEKIKLCRSSGADAVMHKPITMEKIAKIFDNHF